DGWIDVFGEAELRGVMPLRRALSLGLRVQANSDFPCSPMSPFLHLKSAVARQTRAGKGPRPRSGHQRGRGPALADHRSGLRRVRGRPTGKPGARQARGRHRGLRRPVSDAGGRPGPDQGGPDHGGRGDRLRASPTPRGTMMRPQPLPWPNGANIAVTLTVAWEAWSPGVAEARGDVPTVPRAWRDKGAPDLINESWQASGTRGGLGRLMDLLARCHVATTAVFRGLALERHPEP